MPTPPAGTDTLVFSATGQQVQALVGSPTVMTAWNLAAGGWSKGQVLGVQISFGSSN
jgi:hypothetical protein